MKRFSLKDLSKDLEEKDLLLEGTITIRVDVSMERPHVYTKDDKGKPKLTLGKGWLVSLGLSPSSPDTGPFSDGESLMVCDMRYLSEEEGPIELIDVIRALGIDPDAKIWNVQSAP